MLNVADETCATDSLTSLDATARIIIIHRGSNPFIKCEASGHVRFG